MRLGTRSLLFGAHCFFLHPLFVLWAWKRLYGMPWDPRLWLAAACHDLGYWGRAAMDSEDGERHVELGARIMSLFGPAWRDLTLYHSRFYAVRDGQHYSRLCVADKLAFVLTPAWLYLPMARATGEVYEYMATARGVRGGVVIGGDLALWHAYVKEYLADWVEAHKDGADDTWTKP